MYFCSYRSLARSKHPDKFNDPELKIKAKADFVELAHAYEVLSDPISKRRYKYLILTGIFSLFWEPHIDNCLMLSRYSCV